MKYLRTAGQLSVKGKLSTTGRVKKMPLTWALVLVLLTVGYGFSSAAWLLIPTGLDDAARA